MRSLFEDLFSDFLSNNSKIGNFPKDGDPNFNKTIDESENETHILLKETWRSIDGTKFYQRTTSKPKSKEPQPSIDQLKTELKKLVESEDFENAAKVRDKIKSLETKK